MTMLVLARPKQERMGFRSTQAIYDSTSCRVLVAQAFNPSGGRDR